MAELTLPTPARCVKVLLAMVPQLMLLPVFNGEDGGHSTHADSSPTTLAHAVYQALKARGLSVRPLPAGPAGSKDSKGDGGNNDGNARGSGRESDCVPDWDGSPPPPPPSGGVAATRVAGE